MRISPQRDCNIIITKFIRTEKYNHLKSDLAGLILFYTLKL